jgi:outer membrane immunogenic protein
MRQYLLAAVTLALGATGAHAADLVMDAPTAIVDPTSYDWSGLYAGVHAGLAGGNDHSVFDVDPVGGALTTIDLGLSGGLAGVQVGVDQQVGAFVLGAEGRIAWTNVSGTNAPAGIGGAIDNINGKFEASVLGRVGYAFDRFLPYVTAGVSALNYDRQVTIPPAVSSANSTALGLSVGVGAKFAVNEHLVLFGEYLHTGYGQTTTKTPAVATPPGVFGETIQDTITTDKILVGVNWRF